MTSARFNAVTEEPVQIGFGFRFVLFGANIRQFVAGFASEVSIVSKQSDSPTNLFGNTLPRPVSAGKQFEIGKVIFRRRLDFVMDRFFGSKLSAEMLLHDISMFQDFAAFDAVFVRKTESNVALFSKTAVNGSLFGRSDSVMLGEFEDRTACGATQFHAAVQNAAFFSSSGYFLAALHAVRDMFVVTIHAAADRVTGDRAIERPSAELLLIPPELSGHPTERLVAYATVEEDGIGMPLHRAVDSFVASVTWRAAEFSREVFLLVDREIRVALNACKLGSHKLLRVLSDVANYNYHSLFFFASEEIAGVA